MLVLWWMLIHALGEFIEPVTKTARSPIHITVGPGCLTVPTPSQPEVFNAADNVTCPFNPTVANKLGPVITARGGADWKQKLAAVKTAETKDNSQVFHYAFDFLSANLSCAEKDTASVTVSWSGRSGCGGRSTRARRRGADDDVAGGRGAEQRDGDHLPP